MAEIKIILSPMSMSLNDLDEKKVNFDNLHHATTSSAAAAAVDGNDNDNIVDKETTKGCECEGEEEEVVCSFKTLPQPLRLTITERSSPTTAKGAGSQGDDGSIEVEVKKCAPTTAGLPSATDIRSSSSSSDSAQSDQLKVRADNNHSSAAADDTGYTSVEKPVDDKVDYQPDFSEASNGAREGDSSDSGSILGSTKASSVSPSPLKGDNDGIMSRQKDQQRIDCNCNCSYSEEASMTMTAHLGSTGTTSFPSTGLGEALCVPQKPRTCTEDSSLLTTASSTTTPVEVIDNNVEEEEDNDTVSDSLALLNVSRDGGMVMDNAPRRGTANSESECSSTTAPMITFRLLGEDLIDNISMNSDRMTATTESMDDNRSKSIISDGSEETGITPSQLGKIMHIRVSPKAEENEAARSLRTSNACIGYYDKTKLTERLKERLSKRDQTNGGADASSPTTEVGWESSKPVRDLARDRLRWESRLQTASQQRRPCVPRAKSSSFTKATTNRDMRFPDTVAFSDGSDDGTNPQPQHHRQGDTKVRSHYRKSFSEVGIPSSFSTTGRSSRSKLTKNRQSLAHGIGILQPDGIVYDDALLLRLARNARYGRLRGEVVNAAPYDNDGLAAGGARQYNHVKIHVYDLMTNDSLVEMPYFNCNFPIGHCFKVVNDGCHMFGTGAYHVGVEVSRRFCCFLITTQTEWGRSHQLLTLLFASTTHML